MIKFFKRNILFASVFITGACVLIIEVVAVRILSPYYGNTIFTVSSVITVILAALSLGYYAGGRLADKRPSLKLFFSIILISSLVLLGLHFIGSAFLPFLGYFFSISLGPLISSSLLFFLPAFLLGTLSPFAIKLQKTLLPEQGIGNVSGKIFFWSTLGSIFGSLGTGFVLIPRLGISQIIIATGVVLFLLGALPLLKLKAKKEYLQNAAILFIVLAGAMFFWIRQTESSFIFVRDGIYEKIKIFDRQHKGRPTRFLQQDRGLSGAMFLDSEDPKDLAVDYTKYYLVYKIFKPEIGSALVLGGGAYSVPRALLAENPELVVDVCEIEPSLFGLAREYFNLPDSSRLRNYIEDGRRFLHDSEKKYDLIFSDVYYSLFSVPSHFTTQEFFKIAKEKISQNGLFVANLIGDLSKQQPSFIMSEIKTFQTVFPNSYFFAVESPSEISFQNIIFVGHNSNKKTDIENLPLENYSDPVLLSLKEKMIDLGEFDLSLYPILLDNFSPTDYLIARMLQRHPLQ